MNDADDALELENHTFDELNVGDCATIARKLTREDIELFAVMSGDVNPAHLDADYAARTRFHDVIAHGMWGGALISAVLGTELPGPGTVYVSQTLSFSRPVHIGDEIRTTCTVKSKDPATGRVTLACACVNGKGQVVIAGDAEVMAPREKVRRRRASLPSVVFHERGRRLQSIIDEAAKSEPLRVAVVHPVDAKSLGGAVQAADLGIIDPVLVGPEAKIRAAAEEAGLDISPYRLVATAHSHAAAEEAARLAGNGEAAALMKGALHTDELMGAVVSRASGLRTERRVSHVYVMDAPAYPKTMFLTDAAVNIAPDLDDKRDILQNAIDLARALGVETPKAALLAAVETVSAKMQSTIDAAALCKMADRGQITGALVDGPLAFDNAISPEAARTKGIISPVAGDADILLAPDIEAGNMLAKQLDYLAGAVAAGVVLGARVPVILTSRAEGERARIAACAAAKLFAERRAAL